MQSLHDTTLYIHDDIEDGQSNQEDDGREPLASSPATTPLQPVLDPLYPIQTATNLTPINVSPIYATHVKSSILSSSLHHDDAREQLSLPPSHLSVDVVGSMHQDGLDTWHASTATSGECDRAICSQPLKLCSSFTGTRQPSEDDENLLLDLDPGFQHLYHDLTLYALGTISRPLSIGALAHNHLQALGRGECC